MLFFFTGGLAIADVKAFDLTAPESGSKLRTGWTLGGGIERKIQGPVSLKLEYLYSDFGKSEHFQNSGHTLRQSQSTRTP